jgi:hypothetical protein
MLLYIEQEAAEHVNWRKALSGTRIVEKRGNVNSGSR